MNQMKDIPIEEEEVEVEQVETSKREVKDTQQRREKDSEKRKGHSVTPMYHFGNSELSSTFNTFNQWHKDEGI